MVRRSKRGAKSEQTNEEPAPDEQVSGETCSGEAEAGNSEDHSADQENNLKDVAMTCEPYSLSEPVGEVGPAAGESKEVEIGSSENDTGEDKVTGERCRGGDIKDPTSGKMRAAINEVMSPNAQVEKSPACESEVPHEKQAVAQAPAADDQPLSDEAGEKSEEVAASDEKELDRCLYCDDRSFSVSDVAAYVAHLETEHKVVRNAQLLARITIEHHRQDNLRNARLEAVSPEPFEEAKLPPVEDIESESEDDEDKEDQDILDDNGVGEETESAKGPDQQDVHMDLDTTKDKVGEANLPAEEEPVEPSASKEGLPVAEDIDTHDASQATTNIDSEENMETVKVEVGVTSSPTVPGSDEGAPILKEELVEKDEDGKQEGAALDSLPGNEPVQAEMKSPDSNKDNGDMLTIMASGEDGFGAEEEAELESKVKQDEVLSDLSLSDDDFSKEDSADMEEKQVPEEPVQQKQQKTDEELCAKCDTPHAVGQRCVFIIKGSTNGGSKRSRPREVSRPRPRIRTLPPELYHHPDDLARERSYRSRSPPPTRIRRAPTPPSAYERNRDRYLAEERERRAPPPNNQFGDKRCKMCNMTGHLVKSCPDLFCYVCKQQGHFAKECPGGGRDRSRQSPAPPRVAPVFGAPPPPEKEYAAPPRAPAAPPIQEHQGYAQYYPPPAPQTHTHPLLPTNSAPLPYPPGMPQAYTGSHYQAGPTASTTDSNKPAHYAEALSSLAPLQAFMNTKLQCSSSSSGYPPSYIELLVTNVGKMFALANLSLPSLEATFFSHGETFLRSRISRELQVYAQQFPKGVNMPIVIETTVEFLKTQAGLGRQFSY